MSRPDALRARITEAGPDALLPIGHAFAKSARSESQRQWYSLIILRWDDTILNRHFGAQYCMPCLGLPLTLTWTIRPLELEHSTFDISLVTSSSLQYGLSGAQTNARSLQDQRCSLDPVDPFSTPGRARCLLKPVGANECTSNMPCGISSRITILRQSLDRRHS